jgi:hypothetical protein
MKPLSKNNVVERERWETYPKTKVKGKCSMLPIIERKAKKKGITFQIIGNNLFLIKDWKEIVMEQKVLSPHIFFLYELQMETTAHNVPFGEHILCICA